MLGSAYYHIWLFVAVLLSPALCLVPIVLLMTMTRNRQKEPVVFVSQDIARRHTALIWLIRGTYVISAVLAAILLLLLVLVFPLGAIGKIIIDASNPWIYRIPMAFAILTIILLFGLIVRKVYYDSFRKDAWKVNAETVGNFSFIFAVLFAIDWYHILPPYLPKIIADYCMSHPALVPFAEQGHGPTYRGMLSFVAFYIFFRLTKAYLMHLLLLDSSESPKEPPIDPDIPEFPQKSPLVQM